MGRMAASTCVACNCGCGPWFARTISAQAHHFEAQNCLKPSLQGRNRVITSLLDDKDVFMGLK